MKNRIRILIVVALTAFMHPAFAGDAANVAAQNNPAKFALYDKFVAERGQNNPASQKAAYETAKEYLSRFGAPEDQFNRYVREWVGKYEKAVRVFEFEQAIYAKDLAKARNLGQQILAGDPNYVDVHLRLAHAGLAYYVTTRNKDMNAATLDTARAALKLLDQGKEPLRWTVFKDREEALGGLNYLMGFFTLENSPDEATPHLIKAAQSNSKFKSEPSTYQYLAVAYYKGEVSKLVAEYKGKHEGKPETPEGLALYAKVHQSLDRVIDAYARAAALSRDPVEKKSIMETLTAVYKSRHEKSDAGLNELVADILNRPLPVPPGL